MPSLEDVLGGFLKQYPSNTNKEAVEHCLEAHRKLVDLHSTLTPCDGIGVDENTFKVAYNQFRRGGPL